MRWKAARESKFVLAVSYLLLITIVSLFLHYYLEGILVPSRLEAFQNAPGKGFEGVRQKAVDGPALAVNKASLRFVSSLSLLRFDLKQNLRTWPVLSNGLARSPPTFTFSSTTRSIN